MKRNRVLFHTPSFHIFQFFIVFYNPAQAAVTPWYSHVVIFSISSCLRHALVYRIQRNGRSVWTSYMQRWCEAYTPCGRFWTASCCRIGIDVPLVQQFLFESRNVFKQVLPRKDFTRLLIVHVLEQQLYNVCVALQHFLIYHFKVMVYTQIWKFLYFSESRNEPDLIAR